ncbi:hypothetical protein [Mucilaginibacter sp. R-33]|uniref:hypothetical protein n=1 Tax=Mucilaginibacter sp. R-33 TaxID=3416711 RepID=UPI003CF3A9C3
MQLIGKVKILEFLQSMPGATVPLILWTKEFEHKAGKRLAAQIDNRMIDQSVICTALFGIDAYALQYCVNPWLSYGVIKWIGTRNELAQIENNIIADLQANDPSLKKVEISSPIEFNNNLLLQDRTMDNLESKINGDSGSGDQYRSSHSEEVHTFQTYRAALQIINALFDTQNNSAQFATLKFLADELFSYEIKNFKLPEIKLLDIITYKIKELGLQPPYLETLMSKDDSIYSYLSGRQMNLSRESINNLVGKLGISIPVSDLL